MNELTDSQMRMNTVSKIITAVFLCALLLTLDGCCMTDWAVRRAKGYTYEQVQVSKGDKLIENDGAYYVIEHPKNADVSKSSMPDNMPTPSAGHLWVFYRYKPEPAFYALLPLTIPADIVTFPYQLYALASLSHI